MSVHSKVEAFHRKCVLSQQHRLSSRPYKTRLLIRTKRTNTFRLVEPSLIGRVLVYSGFRQFGHEVIGHVHVFHGGLELFVVIVKLERF